MSILPNLEEDSKDLTAEEINSAVIVATQDAMIEHLRKTRCSQCKQIIAVKKHELRRCFPFLYSRMTLFCAENHNQTILFRLDWLLKSL